MGPIEPTSILITDPSGAGEARRVGQAIAASVGFDEAGRGRVGLVITEMATNLAKHAQQGEILLHWIEGGTSSGIEILAIDRGPGMADLARCLTDGYSTAGSPGTGLGSIQRLASSFDIHTIPGVGTALVARLWMGPTPPATRFEVGAVCLPVAGERECGDSWAVDGRTGPASMIVADGLGHGPQAAVASRRAVQVFRESPGLAPAEVIQRAHEALRPTRGAAVAVIEADPERREVRIAGVGNIAASVVDPETAERRNLVSHNGIVGHELRRVQEFTSPWPPGALLILCSDGLLTQWRLDRYPGLLRRDPALIAGVLYRDFRRGRDDATVVVWREGGAPT